MKRRDLNEMGTPRQNAFLKSLMGNRYDSNYDGLPADMTSQLIQQELNKKKLQQNNPNAATDRQIDFIANNKYMPVPSITTVRDQLTKDDATTLVQALNPYTNGQNTYYGHARQKKEEWLPEMRDTTVPILKKYGLDNEADSIIQLTDNFLTKLKQKQDKKEQKEIQQKLLKLKNDPNTLYLISTKDIEDEQTQRISPYVWMDGILQDKMGWDIAGLNTDETNLTISDITNIVLKSYSGIQGFPALVKNYDRPCYAVLWAGYDAMPRLVLCGRIVDYKDYTRAYMLAEQLVYKPDSGGHI